MMCAVRRARLLPVTFLMKLRSVRNEEQFTSWFNPVNICSDAVTHTWLRSLLVLCERYFLPSEQKWSDMKFHFCWTVGRAAVHTSRRSLGVQRCFNASWAEQRGRTPHLTRQILMDRGATTAQFCTLRKLNQPCTHARFSPRHVLHVKWKILLRQRTCSNVSPKTSTSANCRQMETSEELHKPKTKLMKYNQKHSKSKRFQNKSTLRKTHDTACTWQSLNKDLLQFRLWNWIKS